MGDPNETVRILNAETHEQLIKNRDDEVENVLKLRLVLQQLRRLRVYCSAELSKEESESIARALKLLRIGDFLRIGDDTDMCLLNLRDCLNATTLSYIERKVVRLQLITDLKTDLKAIIEFGRKLHADFSVTIIKNNGSAVDNITSLSSTSSTTSIQPQTTPSDSIQNHIIALEKQRRDNLQRLVTLRNKKCAYLKVAAELKMGPYLAHELELLSAEARMNQCKTNVLRGFFINDLLSRSEHSLKALKEVEGYVDKALELKEVD